jgi:STE24 endopeptidase
MNFIQIIILAAVLTYFLLNLISVYLNINNFKKDVPYGFEDCFDKTEYRKSQEYILLNSKAEIIKETFDLAVFLIFWFSGGFGYLDMWVRGFDLNPVLSGLLYIGVLIFAKALLDTPFSIYDTFVIEQRFGFNKTTPGLYIQDKLKMLLLSGIIGVPLISGVLAFFEYAGDYAWVLCWAVFTGFMLIMQVIVPVWIMPLFNKFYPLEDGELKEKVLKYARENNFPVQNVMVMDGSKRSGKSNAFFAGFGKTKRLVLFDTIIKNHSPDEIVSIIAHETGHYKKKHIIFVTVLAVLQAGIMFYLLSLFITYEKLFSAFYLENVSVYAGLVFFGFLYAPADFFINLAMLGLSRRNEFEADKYAAETTENKSFFINTLKKLSADNYSNLTPHPFYVFLNYSHPPVIQRIDKINSLTL